MFTAVNPHFTMPGCGLPTMKNVLTNDENHFEYSYNSRRALLFALSSVKLFQNLEPSSVSRQYATLLLDAALDHCKWELSKDLVRFLRAIGKHIIL
jgi:hypothetical protein